MLHHLTGTAENDCDSSAIIFSRIREDFRI